MFKEVKTDATVSSIGAPTACVLRDPCCSGYRDHLMVLSWAQQPDLRKVFPHSREVTELLAQGPL